MLRTTRPANFLIAPPSVVLWLAVGWPACTTAPEGRVARLFEAASAGDRPAIVASFTEDSQPVVDVWLGSADGAELLPPTGEPMPTIGEPRIKEMRSTRGRVQQVAWVEARDSRGSTIDIPLILEHNQWKVDLFRLARSRSPRSLGSYSLEAEMMEAAP